MNTAIRGLVGLADATSAADDSRAALALPQAVVSYLVLSSHKVLNQALHDKCAAAAARIAAAAQELAVMLRHEADNVARDSNRSTVPQNETGYLQLMLDTSILGPASHTSCLPQGVRAVLATALLTRTGARAVRTADEVSEVRGRVSCALRLAERS